MIRNNKHVCCFAYLLLVQPRKHSGKMFICGLDRRDNRGRSGRGFMLRLVGLTQPQDGKSRHAVFPKKLCQRFGRTGIFLQMCGGKWTKRFSDRINRSARQ